jgi:hypothetical protein
VSRGTGCECGGLCGDRPDRNLGAARAAGRVLFSLGEADPLPVTIV